ncbi:MAG: short-chain dehydrogenase/reductase [Frankiales bacterium]|nr:short-chain dehydrogenase/reductase [Frankiales bacterium]
MPLALITGASRGLGLALGRALAGEGWSLVLDARHDQDLRRAAPAEAVVIPGDVTDPEHRQQLLEAVAAHGRLDLLVNNASYLGPSPQPLLRQYPLAELRRVYEVDVFAPLALVQLLLPLLRHGTIVNVSSDAGTEAYAGWGGYGSAKAALDQLTAVLALEQPQLRVLAFDPGDMRTQMQREAFPGEDISDRPLPETVVPAMLALLDLSSGRYRASELLPTVSR